MVSSCSNPLWKYDVFLSFCGKDTRKTFVSHLYRELDNSGITVFKDDKELERGTYINSELVEGIRESRFAIVIVSKNYAFSSWCLRELEEIIKCSQEGSLTLILPIFYEVDPSDIRKQRGAFSEAFKKHEMENFNNVESWKQALTRVANISGEDSAKWMDESKLIQRISTEILDRLNSTLSSDWSHLVGIGAHMEAIDPLLNQASNNEVGMIGICGMGGIGKTTIAKYIYQRLYTRFQAYCFLDNVREKQASHGLMYLQEHLLSTILKKRDLKLPSTVEGSDIIKARLRHLKVFIVLDDIDKRDQLNALAGNSNWFGPGSRLIITSRDKGIFSTWPVYEVTSLNDDDAIKLFSQFAFGKRYPEEGFLELSTRAIKYACGLPLAIKVWGSFLNGMGKEEWEIAQFELEQRLHGDIRKVLRVSYDGLDDPAKDIFLYIAFFFKEEKIDRVTRLLSSIYSNVEFWVRVLAKKSLVDVSPFGFISMHDLLQEMAREIIKQSIDQPGKQKFLTDSTEIYDVLTDFTGTKSVEGILLDLSKVNELMLTDQAFERMPNLRFLKFYINYELRYGNNTKVRAEGLSYLPRKLVALLWDHYPLRSLPSKFRPECLVELCMPYSDLETLWEETSALRNLKEMDLRFCRKLNLIPDLSMTTKLEVLDFATCESLVEVPSIQSLRKLICLELVCCIRLERLPDLHNMLSLEYLCLLRCLRIKSFPQVPTSIKRLNLSGTGIEEVPPSIGRLPGLVHLILWSCRRLKIISNEIENLSNLEEMDLTSCTMLTNIPKEIQKMKSMKCLRLGNCKQLQSLPKLPESLICCMAYGCSSLLKITQSSSLPFDLGVLKNYLKLHGNLEAEQMASYSCRKKGTILTALLPGCEVPDCFNYRARGSSVTISMPQNCHLVGFLASIVVTTKEIFFDMGKFYVECWLSPKKGANKNMLEGRSAHFCVNHVIPYSRSGWRNSFIHPPPHEISYTTRAIYDSLVHRWEFMEIGNFDKHLYLFGWYFDKPEKCTKMMIKGSGEYFYRPCKFKIEECGVCPIFIEDLAKEDSTRKVERKFKNFNGEVFAGIIPGLFSIHV